MVQETGIMAFKKSGGEQGMKEGITREQSATLRGLAILMMIYHHLFATPEPYLQDYFSVLRFGGINVEHYLAWFCKIALGIYLFLSGYGMCYVFRKRVEGSPAGESFAGFLLGCYRQVLAKVGRLYVQYWYALIVAMSVIFLFDPEEPAFSLKEFLLNMSGLSYSYNGTWWYVLYYAKIMLILPFAAAFFHRFSEPGQEKKKRIFYAAVLLAVLLCLFSGLLWFPGLLKLMLWAGHDLRISFFLVFIVGYLMARFSVYQKMCREKMLLKGVIALVVSVAVRVLLSNEPAYAKTDFLIVPVFAFGALVLLERLPRLSAVLRFFGGLSTYMWFVHTFFWNVALRPFVLFTGVSTGIFLTIVAMAAGAAMLLKAGAALPGRIRERKNAGAHLTK